MLFSYERSFISIHVDKTAGSSIECALLPYAHPKSRNRLRRRLVWLGVLNRVAGLYRAVEFPEHVAARVVKRCLPPAVYDGAFKFAFVRNPWDRLVSRYNYLLRNESHHRCHFVKGLKGFEAYLEWEIRRGKMFQQNYVTDAGGGVIVDFIGYFERLNEDFARVCARIGVQAELPHANSTNHSDYRTYYTPATRERVAQIFRRDIELFGYEFDGLVPRASAQFDRIHARHSKGDPVRQQHRLPATSG
jgi:hypothetical protein